MVLCLVSSQHSHNLESFYAHIGLIVMAPALLDAKECLKRQSAITIRLSSLRMNSFTVQLRSSRRRIHVPIGKGDIKREGTDVTICAHLRQVLLAQEAADILAKYQLEIVDPRTIKPLVSI